MKMILRGETKKTSLIDRFSYKLSHMLVLLAIDRHRRCQPIAGEFERLRQHSGDPGVRLVSYISQSPRRDIDGQI